ncbi:hypothetical protein ACN47E_008235 [Coniothyrium glycines]
MKNLRFAVALQRLVPFLDYHHILMCGQIIMIILVCM